MLAEVKVRIGLTIGPCWLHLLTVHKSATDVVQEEDLELTAQFYFQSIDTLAEWGREGAHAEHFDQSSQRRVAMRREACGFGV